MTVLNDAGLRKLYPDSLSVGPSSMDVHLGDSLIRLPYGVTLDPERDQSELWQDVPLRADGRWMLGQGSLYLGVTAETISVPIDHVALLHGISSLGRLGLLIHITAGLIDAGNELKLTLELLSLGGSILLRPGMRIGQVTYHQMTAPAEHPYRGKYLNDLWPVPSRMYQETKP